jgi:tripartite-type tricarboxylate transporter receptor subunit TctC
MPRIAISILVLLISLFGHTAAGANWPERPIRIIVPYPAGGATDQIARALVPGLTEILKQPVIVDNRAGASGAIGMQATLSAPADGYTLYFGNNGPNAILPSLRKLGFDPLTELKPISLTAIVPLILTIAADFPAQNLGEFLARLRADTGKLNYGSVGNGSLSHLAGEYFRNLTDNKSVHIAYKGGAPLMTALGSGEVHYAFATGIDADALMKAGKVRYLAVATDQSTAIVPGLPAVAEQVPGFSSVAWFGLLAASAVPDGVIKILNDAINQVVSRAEIRSLFAQRNIEARGGTPTEFDRLIRNEVRLWADVIKRSNITE